jgi:hypothetical protein
VKAALPSVDEQHSTTDDSVSRDDSADAQRVHVRRVVHAVVTTSPPRRRSLRLVRGRQCTGDDDSRRESSDVDESMDTLYGDEVDDDDRGDGDNAHDASSTRS